MALCAWRITAQTNRDPLASDQAAYVGLAREQDGAWWPFATDGTRNGLISWLAALAFDPHAAGFFLEAKRLNAALGIVATLGWGLWFARHFPALAAWNLTALAGLGSFLGISTFFGGELLLYAAFFGFWISALRALSGEGSWRAFAAAGGFAAAAALAKPSVGPAIQIFAAFALLGAACGALAPRWPALSMAALAPNRTAAGLLLFFAIVAACMAPRMADAARKFGDPFYNLSRYTFWLDDWDAAFPHLAKFRRDRLHELEESLQPGFARAWRRLGPEGFARRVREGVVLRLRQLFLPEKRLFHEPGRTGPRRVILPNRGLYLLGAFALAASAAMTAWARKAIPPPRTWLLSAAFAGACAVAYLLAFAWFAPIGPGHRFVMMFYLPLLGTALLVAERLRQRVSLRAMDALFGIVYLAAAVLLAFRLATLAASPVFGELRYAF